MWLIARVPLVLAPRPITPPSAAHASPVSARPIRLHASRCQTPTLLSTYAIPRKLHKRYRLYPSISLKMKLVGKPSFDKADTHHFDLPRGFVSSFLNAPRSLGKSSTPLRLLASSDGTARVGHSALALWAEIPIPGPSRPIGLPACQLPPIAICSAAPPPQ